MQKDLDVLRNKIQKIDHEIVSLLNQRIEAVDQIGQIKIKLGMPIIDKEREKHVLSHVMNTSHNPVHSNSIQKIYQTIIQICRETQMNASTKNRNGN